MKKHNLLLVMQVDDIVITACDTENRLVHSNDIFVRCICQMRMHTYMYYSSVYVCIYVHDVYLYCFCTTMVVVR